MLLLAFAGAAFCGCGRLGFAVTQADAAVDGASTADARVDTGREGDAGPADGGSPGASQVFVSPDLTGDGIADLVVASTSAVHVFSGRSGFSPGGVADAFAVITATAPCTIRATVLRADVDGDGSTDLLVGHECSGDSGAAVVPGPFAAGTRDLADLRRISLAPPGIGLGRLGIGDLSGDGRPDLIASLPGGRARSGLATGLVRVFFGLETLGADPPPDVTLEGEADADGFGTKTDIRPGDVTGDGIPDLLVGAYQADLSGVDSGGAYLFAGPLTAGTYQAADLACGRLLGRSAGSLAGVGVALWDADQDGRLDMLVGADEDPGSGAYAGRVFIFLGPVACGTRSVVEAERYVTGTSPDELGTFLDASGDIDGDGWRDLLVWGCCGRDGALQSIGNLSGVFATPAFSSRDRSTVDFHYRGEDDRGNWGRAVSIGDVDADGTEDFAAMHPNANAGDGAVYVFFGRASFPPGPPGARADVIIRGPAGLGTRFGADVAPR